MRNSIFFLLGLLISVCFVGSVHAYCIKNGSLGESPEIGWYKPSSHSGAYNLISKFGEVSCSNSSGTDYRALVRTDNSKASIWIFYGPSGCETVLKFYYSGITTNFDCVQIPPEYTNGVQDLDETGIDCGGSNPTPCVSSCPGGTEEVNGFDGDPGCYWYGLTDSYGNCPPGSSSSAAYGLPKGCYKKYDYILAASTITPETITPPTFSKGSFSVVESTSPTQTMDNGDGTSTKTDVTTSTDSKGNSKTTTTTSIVNNDTNQVISSTTTINEDTPEEENPDNYDIPGPIPVEYDHNLEAGVDYPDETDLESLLDSFSDNSVISSIKNSGISLSSSSCSISATMFNHQFAISFCDPQIIEWLSYLGVLLVSITYLTTPFIIFGRG